MLYHFKCVKEMEVVKYHYVSSTDGSPSDRVVMRWCCVDGSCEGLYVDMDQARRIRDDIDRVLATGK